MFKAREPFQGETQCPQVSDLRIFNQLRKSETCGHCATHQRCWRASLLQKFSAQLKIPILNSQSRIPNPPIPNSQPTNLPFMTATTIQRDLSWLSFNYRVLQEAKDANVPLFERLKFLAIYSSNLDEFFRVRVAHHRNILRAGKKHQQILDYDPKITLRDLLKIVHKHQEEFSEILHGVIIPELAEHNIRLVRRLELNDDQKLFVENYFRDYMLPFVQPVLLVKNKIRPFLNNASLYLAILLKNKGVAHSTPKYAIVKIPSDHLPRFIDLPSVAGKHDIMLIDDMVRHSVSWLFPGYEIVDTYSIKLTRDAELYIDDEFSGDLVEKIKNSLSKRNVGNQSRFVYDRQMPEPFLDFLVETFDIDRIDLLPEGRYQNKSDFFRFPDFGMSYLKYPKLEPLPYAPLENAPNIFDEIAKKDHLLYTPFQSYESVIRFFEDAAKDPHITDIKIVLYRAAKKSRILNALMDAVEAGKRVSVFIEVKARFDEEANIRWGEILEKSGVEVHYSFPGVKVHSKLALICRNEGAQRRCYAFLSTGNFHEDTARIYTDFGLFTAHEAINQEVAQVFRYLETGSAPAARFKHLLVGQFNLRNTLVKHIQREIDAAKAGQPASIILKMNSLQDGEMIEKLYEASRAGVKIKLIIRGICCLMAGVKGMSENIEAISIVDRFLEHARVFIFHNGGKEEIYLASADWMERNLSYRVETAFPVYDPEIRNTIRNTIRIQLSDNVKARILDKHQSNKYKHTDGAAVRSQTALYDFFKEK
jgi:polyphosphate kinase